jgi:hypothetical protein
MSNPSSSLCLAFILSETLACASSSVFRREPRCAACRGSASLDADWAFLSSASKFDILVVVFESDLETEARSSMIGLSSGGIEEVVSVKREPPSRLLFVARDRSISGEIVLASTPG